MGPATITWLRETSVRVAPGVPRLDDGSALAQFRQPVYPWIKRLILNKTVSSCLSRTDEEECNSPHSSRGEGRGQQNRSLAIFCVQPMNYELMSKESVLGIAWCGLHLMISLPLYSIPRWITRKLYQLKWQSFMIKLHDIKSDDKTVHFAPCYFAPSLLSLKMCNLFTLRRDSSIHQLSSS